MLIVKKVFGEVSSISLILSSKGISSKNEYIGNETLSDPLREHVKLLVIVLL